MRIRITDSKRELKLNEPILIHSFIHRFSNKILGGPVSFFYLSGSFPHRPGRLRESYDGYGGDTDSIINHHHRDMWQEPVSRPIVSFSPIASTALLRPHISLGCGLQSP